jgi:hypothetical protein
MRFLLPDPLGNDKHSQMFHSSGFAIAAGVVAVGAAAGSAAISMSAADRAKKAQGKAGASYQKQLKQATNQYIQQQDAVKKKISKIDPNLKIPEFKLENATLEAITAANQITANTLQQIDRIVPGSTEARGQVMQSIGQWENNLNQQYQNLQANQGLIDQQRQAVSALIEGRTTPQQDQQFNRRIAEGLGGSFNMQTARLGLGGFQTAQATYADQLMQSGERRMLAGLQLAPGVNEQQRGLAGSSIALSEGFRGLKNTMGTWMSLADAWKQNVPQVMGIGLQGRGQNIQVQQYGIQNAFEQQGLLSQINQGNYAAMTGQAQNIYGINKDNAAASYAAQQAVGQGVSDIGQATSGALSGYSGALGKLAAAKGGGGGYAGGFNYEQVYGPATYGSGEFSNFNEARG